MTTTFLRSSMTRGTGAFGPFFDPYDHPMRDQTMTTAPTFPPFKFEPRRARIDWRLLHGIDINSMMRDVDLDTLEKIVNIVAFGDIEAEDTRHLTELNFIKIFRLSQMMIEYLLYVQECLQSSNGWLQQDRSNMDKYVQAARLRIRELEAASKMSKRELRRARKTIKTYELLAVLNDGRLPAKDATATGTLGSTFIQTQPAQPAPPPQPAKPAEPNPVTVAMEALLRKELAVLSERLNRATGECATLRGERDELYQVVKELEVAVKSRGHMNGAASPPAYMRQSTDMGQASQALQDQLNKATAEITKLRSEKGELVEELERANGDKRQLTEEKAKLLTELAERGELGGGAGSGGGAESPVRSDNLGGMLLDAEKQKASLQEQLDESRAEITQLQKQLMKAMKATAFAPLGAIGSSGQSVGGSMDDPRAMGLGMGGQGPSASVVRELEAAKAQLERELVELRRTYHDDVGQLQEELEMTQAKAVEADRKLAELRASQAAAAQAGPGSRTSPHQQGGFVKVMDERQRQEEEEERKGMLAEYEAMNDRLNQQLVQLKDERNTLAAEVERLRGQLQGRPSPGRGGRDDQISHDWRTEEIDRLRSELGGTQRRNAELQDALRDRDALVERLRGTIRELQGMLEEQRRPGDPALGRVKQQVQEYEQKAVSGGSFKTSSFSFVPPENVPAAAAQAATPVGLQPSPQKQQQVSPQQGSPSPQPSPSFAPPSPSKPTYALDTSRPMRWLQRIPRPSAAEAAGVRAAVMSRVAGLKPEQLDMMLAEEIRVITENPYEFEEDDEQQFRARLPHELPGRQGVLSVQPHVMQDLEAARGLLTDQLLAVVDDQVARLGVDPTADSLPDKEYAACMQELAARRSKLLERQPREVQERADRLRDALFTHLELVKRRAQREQLEVAQQRLQQDAQAAAAITQQPQAQVQAQAPQQQQQLGGGAEAAGAAGAGAAGLSGMVAVAAAAAAPLGTVASLGRPGSFGQGRQHGGEQQPQAQVVQQQQQQQLPAFPPRQGSMQRSEAASSVGASEDLHPVAPMSGRPPSDAAARALVRRSTAEGASMSGQAALNQSLTGRQSGPASGSGPGITPTMAFNASMASARSGESGAFAAQRVTPQQQGTRASQQQGPISTGWGAVHSEPASSEGSDAHAVGFAAPAAARPQQASQGGGAGQLPVPQPITLAGRASGSGAPGGGNMNMSIRSVKYAESDFDDEEEEDLAAKLPVPKAVARIAAEDEYALTEDEEAQQDMGIEGSEEDFSPGNKPSILIRGSGSPNRAPAQPSRLGPQRTSATGQSRGWATDEPLLPAGPARPMSMHPGGGEEGTEQTTSFSAEVESIQSFNNTLSASLPRRPGAWDSPAGTLRKSSLSHAPAPAAVGVGAAAGARDARSQISGTSRQSDWDEPSDSLHPVQVPSAAGDEVQDMQDITGLESFTDSIRPAGRFAAGMGASQAVASSASRPAAAQPARRTSFTSDISDIEYM